MNDDSWVSKPVKAGFSIEIVIVVVVEGYEVVLRIVLSCCVLAELWHIGGE